MTDPTAHWSPSEVDDDGDRSSYPPPAPLDLDAIEARAAAAYPGPWRAGTVESEGKVWAHDPEALGGPSCGERCVFIANRHFGHTANREFIAHAREDVPALVAALRALVCAVRREHNTRLAWLATLPDRACPNPPPQALLDAEAATRDALRRVT